MGSNPVGITNKRTPLCGCFFIGEISGAEEAIGSESSDSEMSEHCKAMSSSIP